MVFRSGCWKYCGACDHHSHHRNSWSVFLYVIARNGLVIILYYLVSIGLTFYQNHLLREIKLPLFIVSGHLLVKFLISAVIRLTDEVLRKKRRTVLDCTIWFQKLSLVGVCAGLDIALSNWSLEFVTVSLYTMTKSTAIIFILLFALFYGLEESHWSLVVIVTLISGGLVMFTYKSTQFHLLGFLLVLAAAALSGFRWSMSQLLIQKTKLGLENPIDMIYHIQPWMFLAVLPFAIYYEGGRIISADPTVWTISDAQHAERFWFAFNAVLVGSVMAFFIEVTEYLLISFTSSLTLSVAGIFKEIWTMVLAIVVNGDQISPINYAGLFLCIGGITAHIVFKFRKSQTEILDSNSSSEWNKVDDVPLISQEDLEGD